MPLLNLLIEFVTEQGWNTLFYNIFFVAGFVAIFVFNYFNCKNYKIPVGKALIFTVVVYAISTLWMFILCWVENGFKGWGGNNIVRVFIWVPIAALPIAKLMKIDWIRSCDFLAPCVPLVQAVAHWGCIFSGCCHGYPSSWGVVNPATGQIMFPAQPLEALVALAIVVIVCRYERKRDYEPNGYAYPLMLVLFGSTRFFLEFLRDNDKLFLGISSLALHALLMVMVGIAIYLTIKDQESRKKKRVGGRK